MTPARALALLVALPVVTSCAPRYDPIPDLILRDSASAIAPTVTAPAIAPNSTFANPIDIDYRFMADTPSRREAADPLIVLHGDSYYLFASKSGGYWRSTDFREWKLIVPDGLPLDAVAPAVVVLDGRMYFTSHRQDALYVTDDPAAGKWRRIARINPYPDPAFFVDDDGRLYLTYGASLNGAISIVELDPRNDFSVVAGPFTLMSANHAEHGWERSGADNLGAENMMEGFRIAPYIEGPWMTKHNGTYYLQYSAPGTIWRSYADGVYTSSSTTGGFSYAPYSPFSYKPGGFIGGAGHGATFRDKAGNYWRVVTMIVSVKHKFERRLGIFPAGFDADGVMRTNTYLGDYPQFLPTVAPAPLDNNRAGWMLVSRGKPVTASSSVDGRHERFVVDEDVATWWSARSGAPGEWVMVDLGPGATVNAIQVNFAEQDTRAVGEHGYPPPLYVVEHSRDAARWATLVDRGANTRDLAHDYVQLDHPVRTRFVRVRNLRAAGGGLFAVRDLRVFGKGRTAPPARVSSFAVRRETDDRSVSISWHRAARADAYVVRFGVAPEKLYGSYELGNVDRLTMNSLNRGVTYYFTVDAVNEGGVTKSGVVKSG